MDAGAADPRGGVRPLLRGLRRHGLHGRRRLRSCHGAAQRMDSAAPGAAPGLPGPRDADSEHVVQGRHAHGGLGHDALLRIGAAIAGPAAHVRPRVRRPLQHGPGGRPHDAPFRRGGVHPHVRHGAAGGDQPLPPLREALRPAAGPPGPCTSRGDGARGADQCGQGPGGRDHRLPPGRRARAAQGAARRRWGPQSLGCRAG
mmetsp:Transcript_16630/g.49952  ORF Transcript_16630/g.49952 Transcript_16630/m.49952 type:complete len:201 (-) Transcript_16630:58-660(-)